MAVATNVAVEPLIPLPQLPVDALARAYRSARRRLLLLDYGGTLMSKDKSTWQGNTVQSDFAFDAYSTQLPTPVLQALAALAADARSTVFVVSGLAAAAMDALPLARTPHLALVAENGMLVAFPGAGAATGAANAVAGGGSVSVGAARQWAASADLAPAAASAWKDCKERARALMQEYQWRVNGSALREHEFRLAWDFRNADSEWASAQARFLAADLRALAPQTLVRVSLKRSSVEVALRAMDKGGFLASLLQKRAAAPAEDAADFLLVIGDDPTDEDMFVAAAAAGAAAGEAAGAAAAAGAPPPIADVFSVRVGKPATDAPSAARFSLPNVASVHAMLLALAAEASS